MWKLSMMKNAVLYPIFRRLPIYNQAIRSITASSHVNDTASLKSWKEIPGPKSYPIIGPLLSMKLPGGALYNLHIKDMTKALYAKYGPIVKLDKMLNRETMIFIFDAESAALILRGENDMPVRKSVESIAYYRKVKRNAPPGTPAGLAFDQGEQWKKFRSTVNPVLMQPKIIKLYTSVINEVAVDMVNRLKSIRDDKNMILNLEREITLWSLESTSVIGLGRRLRCFDNNVVKDAQVEQFIKVVRDIMKATNDLDNKLSFWKYYPTKTFRSAMENLKKYEDLATLFINEAIKEFQSNPKSDDQKGVLEKLLEINKEVALIMATDMLVAGVETVSHSTLGTLYLLASNPDKQSKLRAELKTNDEKRPYLKACIKEGSRLMPVTFGNKRETTKEHSVLGYKIPKGITVILAHKDMSSMDKYFMKPDEYIPERWIVEKDDPLYFKNGHPFAYGPFGFGVRSCIGRRIAELEMESFIAHAIKHFEIEWFGPPPKIEQELITRMVGPYNFVFKNTEQIL